MDIGIMIEGSDGLTWDRWVRLAEAVELLGYFGLFRSDHYMTYDGPAQDSLELWTSLTWLACSSTSIEFGPLVSPVSFRHPTMTARMASAVDDLSGGRLILGLGAGGWEREHKVFGLDLSDIPRRMGRFEEGVEVIHLLLHSDEPVNFRGDSYNLYDAILLPRPMRAGGPPILIGGVGKQRTLPLAARFGDEWNCVYLTPGRFLEYNKLLDALIEKEGRLRHEVRRSMLTGCVYGTNELNVQEKYQVLPPHNQLTPQLTEAIIRGTSSQIVDQLYALMEAGLERIMLVWYDMTDIDGLESFANAVLPALQA